MTITLLLLMALGMKVAGTSNATLLIEVVELDTPSMARLGNAELQVT